MWINKLWFIHTTDCRTKKKKRLLLHSRTVSYVTKIKFKEKISNRKVIMFKIDYDDLMKLPKKILEILGIN